MPFFEPSTWAEVSEATASHKGVVSTTDTFVTRVRTFTDAPERFLLFAPAGPASAPLALRRLSLTSETPLDDESLFEKGDVTQKLARAPLAAVKRYDSLIDDVLGLGRVDLESQTLIKRASMSNVTEICLNVASNESEKFRASPINPSRNEFDPRVYLARIHKSSTLLELRKGSDILKTICFRLEEDAERFRAEKYASAVSVEAALQRIKRNLHSVSPFAKEEKKHETEGIFERAERMLKERYQAVLRREKDLASLRRTLGVFTRYQWVFALGARLRSCAAEGVSAVESAVREHARTSKWLEAQEGAHLSVIEDDIRNAFEVLIETLSNRLSTGHFSRQDASRLVGVLSSVDREDVLTEALLKRMNFAVGTLRKISQPIGTVAMPDVQGTASVQRETVELVLRSNTAFCEGMAHVWKLGRVLIAQERWFKVVHNHLLSLSQTYVDILKEQLLSDVSLISKEIVTEIVAVRRRALVEIQVPESCLELLADVMKKIADSFLGSISRTIQENAAQIVFQATQSGSVGAETASMFRSLLVEGLEQIDPSVVENEEELDNFSDPDGTDSDGLEDEEQIEDTNTRDDDASMALSLARTCAKLPAMFVKDIHDQLLEKDMPREFFSLKMAVLSAKMLDDVIGIVADKLRSCSLYEARICKEWLLESESSITKIRDESVATYVELVSKPLKTLTAGLVSFPDEDLEDSMSRTVQIKIEGISKRATEVTLQLALITIATRSEGATVDLIRTLLLSLIQTIGGTLVDVLSTDKLIYHRAAQLWVDVTYMQDMITRGADSNTAGLQEALDGYSRAKERSVQAVLADGYSFSIADMGVLKESVIAGGMVQAQMVQDCFRETWALLRVPDTEEE